MEKTYRVAVIGSTGRGDYGHGLDVMWRDVPRTEVVAVADDNAAGLTAAAKRIGVERAFADYRQLLDEVKPDIATIAMRWIDRHAEIATACAERGIHVYMEKPFCRTLAEADAVIRACEMTHTRLALAHTTRYSPLFDRIGKLLGDGAIGQVLEYRGRGKEDRRGGGEDLWVLGSHIMNLMAEYGGAPQWCFARVRQEGRPIRRSDVVDGNEGLGPLAGDDVRATYGLASGATATFQSLRGAAGNPSRFALQIYGSRGIIEIATGYLPTVKLLEDPGWSPGRSGAAWQDVSSAGVGRAEPLAKAPASAGNVAAAKDLIAAIEGQREPLCNGVAGRTAIEMILAVFESQRAGGAVTFPLPRGEHPLLGLS
ncbi:MAG: Gfo/Idh/MocA family protein [Pirellulales bacterium]